MSESALIPFLAHLSAGGHLPQFLAVLDRTPPPQEWVDAAKAASERMFPEEDTSYEDQTDFERACALYRDLNDGKFDYKDYDKRVAQIGALGRILAPYA